MNQGKSRFEFQLNKIEHLLNQADVQENVGAWLFQNDFRTPMFMLEALSKLYATWHNKEKFTDLRMEFKTFEDILGVIDYYAGFKKDFVSNDKIPATVKLFLEINIKQNTKKLNAQLISEQWLNGKRLKKIKEILNSIDWKKEEKEVAFLEKFYKKQIEKIKIFVDDRNFIFKDIELDVHKLRREIRWLSIYPHALQGAIQLKEEKPVVPYLKKYLTPEVKASPYNKLPPPTGLVKTFELETNHFYALSSMIAQLGVLKDNGLKIKILTDALQATSSLNDDDALKSAYQFLGDNYPKMETLLGNSSALVKQFFKEKNLEHLVYSGKKK